MKGDAAELSSGDGRFDPLKVKRFTLVMAIPPVAFWSFFAGVHASVALGNRPSRAGVALVGITLFMLMASCALAIAITLVAGLPFRRLLLVVGMNLSSVVPFVIGWIFEVM